MTRRVDVTSRYRDEDGVVRDHPITLLVGDPAPEELEDDELCFSRIVGHSAADDPSRRIAGDWIPLGHVPTELYPDEDYGPTETEPEPGDVRTRGTRGARP